MGPAAAESNVTIDLLKEAGYKYVMDWPADDQPFWLKHALRPDPVGALSGRVQRFRLDHPPREHARSSSPT